VLAGALFVIVVVAPVVYFRIVYAHSKRLREVDPGRFYRSGQMTAEGLRDAVVQYGIRTVINVQDEFPDPDLDINFWTWETVKESEVCRELGVRYVHIAPELISRKLVPQFRPPAIDQFLALLDKEENYPVLMHCHAGLHRTGVLTAVYRMEHQNYSRLEAWEDMRAAGFGPWVGTIANDYVKQYVTTYVRGVRNHGPQTVKAAGPPSMPAASLVP
jgi:protein tyrosine phosphatase (PTP) superfamily phosphohydrolase (DUF442 family)